MKRRYVEKECAVTREIPRCLEEPVPEKPRPIRCSAEVDEVHHGKSEGPILLRMVGTTEPYRREGALLQSE